MKAWGIVTQVVRGLLLLLSFFVAVVSSPVFVQAADFECALNYTPDLQSGFFVYNGFSYSSEDLLSLEFSATPSVAEYYVAVRMYDDSCRELPDLATGRLKIPETTRDVSVRFVTASQFVIVDNATNAELYSRTFRELPPYVRIAVKLTPFVSGTGDAIDTPALTLSEGAVPPLLVAEEIEKDPACPLREAAGGRFGDFFDRIYERASYENGLLRVQLRLGTIGTAESIRIAGVRSFGVGCGPLGTVVESTLIVPPGSPYLRYFSFRMVSPTAWELWDDEREVPILCTGCSGAISPNTNRVSFRVFNPANGIEPHYVYTTPYQPVEHMECTERCNSNVLFLPGVGGSRLYDTDGGEKRLWEASSDADAEHLLMTSSGVSNRSDIYTRDVIDEAYVPVIGPNVYKSFIASMNDLKASSVINDWIAVPYDWRLSLEQVISNGNKTGDTISYTIATSSPYILQELRRLAATSRTGKVTIIAHSNGGLVAKALMQQLGNTETGNLIDKVIFIAVPHVGTPLAVAALLHGQGQSIPFLLSAGAARSIEQNMPVAYNLIPSSSYFSSTIDPVISFDSLTTPEWVSAYGTAISDAGALKAFMTDSARIKPVTDDLVTPEVNNSLLFDAGQAEHNILDAWAPPLGVQIINVAGWGAETFSEIKYKKVRTCLPLSPICSAYKLTFNPEHVIDGDGTVVIPSALWTSGNTTNHQYWINLNEYNIPLIRQVRHRDIFEIPQLASLIEGLIASTTITVLPQYISTSTPQFVGGGNRLHFTLHSPLSLGFIDNLGNYTGATTTGELFNVPGVHYERYGDVQWISMSADMVGTLIMRGTASGSFTLDAEIVANGEAISGTSFEGIPSATTTVATVAIDPSWSVTASSTLLVDEDGNGSIDLTLGAKEGGSVFPDFTPPSTVASSTGALGLNGWYTGPAQVVLSANDTESGVKNTYFSLDETATTTGTSTMITTQGIHTLRFYSEDISGNIEPASSTTIKADWSPPEAMISVDSLGRDVLTIGIDSLSSTTVIKTATTTTIADQAGNSTTLKWKKQYSGTFLTRANLTSIQYGTSSPKAFSSSLLYVRDAKQTLVSQTIVVDAQFVIQAFYDKRANKTKLIVLKKGVPVQTKTLPGQVLVKLTTDNGSMGYGW